MKLILSSKGSTDKTCPMVRPNDDDHLHHGHTVRRQNLYIQLLFWHVEICLRTVCLSMVEDHCGSNLVTETISQQLNLLQSPAPSREYPPLWQKVGKLPHATVISLRE